MGCLILLAIPVAAGMIWGFWGVVLALAIFGALAIGALEN